MERFTTLTGPAAPVPLANLDTDMIIRVEHSAGLPRDQLGPHALASWRLRADGAPDPDCVLNRPPYDGARILVGGENFGCGSARETAVWALHGFGIRAVIAPSFGGAFHENLFENGMLPIRLPPAQVAALQALVLTAPMLTIDLTAQEIHAEGLTLPFTVEPLRRSMLLEGLDPIGLTLTRDAAIRAFQTADARRRPWLSAAGDR
ncbi:MULTISPECIES: 3-isopropylmalate dehydratase small subunit [Roseomonadaceae]|uniref:3-isopropylmalate dehydratase n=1 Tax=Falsiroseomonas oleicola TaxID=2801474 RepID=A0ABS6H7W0_9PROT|nr:3-isopropylmalate dehydratase small subunit [Roseomonas oleicola]MBU8544788.1 3-isopropylmalate dehydratase small subunit [Roseomonas oleicola]